MPIKNRPMSASEERQHKMIQKALGKTAEHPLAKKILVDHEDDLPRNPKCAVTVEESANYAEYGWRKMNQNSGGSSEYIGIRWIKGWSKGYSDVFQKYIFAKKGVVNEFTHYVVGPHGGHHRARCRLDIQNQVAILDYTKFREFNAWWETEPGILRLHFSDPKRTSLRGSDWKDAGAKHVDSEEAEVIHDMSPILKAFEEELSLPVKHLRMVLARPGQLKFRSRLMLAYGGRCCISGCDVAEALEGAHIDPISGKSSNEPNNGLLLRSDLHALFDAGLLAIQPKTRVVHFAETALTYKDYERLHRAARLRAPEAKSHHPSQGALARRWKLFKSNAGAA